MIKTESEDTEKIDEINNYFIGTNGINDSITNKGKAIKNSNLEYMNINGNLNNKNNPFTKVSNEIKNKKMLTQGNVKEQSKSHKKLLLKTEKWAWNKVYGKITKNFDTRNPKELKYDIIELYEEDKFGDKNNFWFKKFK